MPASSREPQESAAATSRLRRGLQRATDERRETRSVTGPVDLGSASWTISWSRLAEIEALRRDCAVRSAGFPVLAALLLEERHDRVLRPARLGRGSRCRPGAGPVRFEQ